MSLRSLPLLGALLLLTLAPAARASAVLRRSVEEMTARAPLVVRATATSSEARLQGARVYTFTGLRVAETLKGKPPARLVVRQPGGEAGGLGQLVSGTAKFAVGEEVVLFLEPARDDPSVYLVSGMSAGKVRLDRSAEGARAKRSLEGLTLVEDPAAPPPRLRMLDGEDLGTADAFLARVRKAARDTQAVTP